MKKILLAIVAFACAMGTMNAQSDFKPFAKKAGKPANAITLQQGSMLFSQKMDAQVKKTRADEEAVNPKVLSYRTGNDREVYQLGYLPAGETKVATYFSEDLLARFDGNQITAIRTKFFENVDKTVEVWIEDAATGEVLASKSKLVSSTTNKEVEIALSEPYTINANQPILVGYTITLKSDGLISIINNYTDYGLLIQMAGDDGMYDYSGSYPNAYIECVTEGEAGLKTNDVSLVSADAGRVEAGQTIKAPFVFYNYGTEPVKSLTFSYKIGEETFDGSLNLGTENTFGYYIGARGYYEMQTPVAGGILPYEFTITSVNGVADEFPADNTANGSLINIESPAKRVAVMEEFTGTWCGWCTRGIVAVEGLKEAYPNDFIAICVHAEDEMADASYNELLQYVPGFPSATINRGEMVDPYYGSGETIHDDVKAIIETPSEVHLNVSSELSEDKKTINVASTMKFCLSAANDAYSVGYVIVEDGITGVQTNYYDQAYASQTGMSLETLEDDLKPLFTAGHSIQMDFNDVSRKIEGCWGITGSLSGATIASNKSFVHEYTIAVPSSIKNIDNVSVVALFFDNNTGEIVTAAKAKLGEASWTGIDQVANKVNADINVNDGAINIDAKGVVEVYSLDGKLVSNVTANGNVSVPTMGMRGVHVVRVVTAEGIKVAKVTL